MSRTIGRFDDNPSKADMEAFLYLPTNAPAGLTERLETLGLTTRVVRTGADFIAAGAEASPALVVIDGRPSLSAGLDLCRIAAGWSGGDLETLVWIDADPALDFAEILAAGATQVLPSSLSGEALERQLALLHQRLRRHCEDPSVHRALAVSELRFRRLVELSPDTVALHVSGRFVFVNPAGLELFGAESEEQILGRPVTDLVAPEFRGLVEERMRVAHARDEPVPVLEQQMLRLDGSRIDVEVVGVPSAFRGEPATQIVIRNVTERKRTEEALRRSEKRYRELVEGVPVGVYRLCPAGLFLSANRALAEILGFDDARDLLGTSSGILYAEEVDREAWKQLMLGGRRVSDFETRIRRRDGETIWVRSTSRAIFEDDDLVGYEGIVEDITGRRWAEDALRVSEERFRSLVQNASDLISIIDREGKVLYHSPSLIRVLGYQPRERIGAPLGDLVHPEDRPRIEKAFLDLLEEAGRVARIELRIQHRNGSQRVLESILTNLLDQPSVHGIVVNSRDITERKNAEEQLVHDALHDSLTGLPNRVLFLDRLGHCLDKSPRHPDYRFAVLFLDLDRFKLVNDSFGHLIGDQLLVQVSQRLTACLRPTDSLARLGGDEFAILLDDVGDAGNAVRVAGRIREELETPFRLEGREIYSGTSIGIALSTPETREPEELLRDADTAMYRAKSQGRGAHAIFDAAMHEQVTFQMQLETDFHKALQLRQLELFYQPIVDLGSGEVAGFEALVRWRHPQRGLLLPQQFIPLAEETGRIADLGDRVLTHACHQLAKWNRERPAAKALFMSLNLARRQLSQPRFAVTLQNLAKEAGIHRRQLFLEITERAIMDRPEEALEALEAINSLGFPLCLDNFGTGHSSLSLLHRLPVERVKIDRWFVSRLGADQGSDELVEGMLTLCRWRRVETMAVGVESAPQKARLQTLDCTFAQGHLFAPPLEATRIEELLQNSPTLGVVVP